MSQITSLCKPQALVAGDSIGVIATGAPLSPERYQLGVQTIEARGFKAVVPLNPSRDYGNHNNLWSNGSVSERVAAIKQLLENKNVKVILSARGGYGTSHMLPHLDNKLLASHPKPIIGLSDVTPLLAYQTFHSSVVSIHGTSLGSSFADAASSESASRDVDDLINLLSNREYRASYLCQVNREGEGTGRLLVGNLSMFVGMLGSPWDIDYDGKILVIEDVGEAPFQIHRMLSQLAFAGKLSGLAGLVFGRFAKCESKQGPRVEEVFSIVLDDILSDYQYPVYSGLDLGHWGRNIPLGLGCQAELSDGTLSILEAVVA